MGWFNHFTSYFPNFSSSYFSYLVMLCYVTGTVHKADQTCSSSLIPSPVPVRTHPNISRPCCIIQTSNCFETGSNSPHQTSQLLTSSKHSFPPLRKKQKISDSAGGGALWVSLRRNSIRKRTRKQNDERQIIH
jgi:hypothetical protein